MTTTAPSVIVARDGSSGFFPVANLATNSVVPFTVLMSGAAEVPTVNTSATGFGTMTIEGNTLSYHINYSGLSGPPGAAHIHGPATTSQPAGVIVPLGLLGSGTSGTLSGSIDLTALTSSQIAAIRSGRSYANIHTAQNGDGEIRGQIAPVQLTVTLNGANERPTPVNTTASGFGLLSLIGNELTYNITYSGLSSPATAAHIHGPADINGFAGVLQPVSGVSGTSGTLAGTLVLPPRQFGNLIYGLIYANIHHTNKPDGEIPGPIRDP